MFNVRNGRYNYNNLSEQELQQWEDLKKDEIKFKSMEALSNKQLKTMRHKIQNCLAFKGNFNKDEIPLARKMIKDITRFIRLRQKLLLPKGATII